MRHPTRNLTAILSLTLLAACAGMNVADTAAGTYRCGPKGGSIGDAADVTISKIDDNTIGMSAPFFGNAVIPLKKTGQRYQITAAEMKALGINEENFNITWQAQPDGSYVIISDEVTLLSSGQMHRRENVIGAICRRK